MLKLLMVSDQELLHRGLVATLRKHNEIVVADHAYSVEEGLERARRLQPDVVIVDGDMPGAEGIEATRRLVALPATAAVVVVSVHDREPYPQLVLEAGALGYVSKRGPADEILDAVMTVARGEHFISSKVATSLAKKAVFHDDASPIEKLSKREKQIALMIVRGRGVQDISRKLNLSPKTVCTHRYRIYDKVGVKNDVELTWLAIRYGVLDEE